MTDCAVLGCGAIAAYIVWRRIGERFFDSQRLVLLAGGAYLSYVAWKRIQPKILGLCVMGKTDMNIGFREEFKRKFSFLKEKDSESNSQLNTENDFHNVRRLVEESIKTFIIRNELKPYSFSSSTTIATDTVDCHLFYTHQDLDKQYSCKAIGNDHVLYMMDVNYYYNLQQWLKKGRPIILYSFFPTTVGGNCLEGEFGIRNDKITTVYKDGKIYHHQALDLNYNIESFVIKGALFSLVVAVDQFVSPLDPNRRVVCLTPTTWYCSAFNWLSDQQPIELRRMQYEYGNGNILITHVEAKNNQTVPYVSIGLKGGPEVLRLEFSKLLSTCKPLLANNINYYTVENSLRPYGSLYNFSPMIFYIVKSKWLESENNKLLCLKFPATGRSEEKNEDIN